MVLRRLAEHAQVREVVHLRASTRQDRARTVAISELMACSSEVKKRMDVPVRRVEGRSQLYRTLEVVDRRVKIGTPHQCSSEREMRVRGGDV